MLAVEPHKSLSYTWDAMGLESVVTWTLTPTTTRHPFAHGAVGLPAGSGQAYGGANTDGSNFFEKLEQVLAKSG